MRLSLLHKLEDAHEDSIWAAAWAPGSNLLATGSVDETVKVWEENGDVLEKKHSLEGLYLGVVGVAIDPTGAYGAASSLDSMINIWSMADFTPHAAFKQTPSETWSVAWLPGTAGPRLAVAGGSSSTVRLLDVDAQREEHGTKQEPAALAAQRSMDIPAGEDKQRSERFALSVAASPDGRRLAVGCMDGTVAVFDSESGALLCTLPGHFKAVRSLAFTPDSKMLLTACDDMHSHLYDVEHGALVEAFSGHESWVLSVAVHPDGSAFATGGSDARVRLWDLRTRTAAQTVADAGDQVWAVAFRADGSRLAAAADDRSLCLYDVS